MSKLEVDIGISDEEFVIENVEPICQKNMLLLKGVDFVN